MANITRYNPFEDLFNDFGKGFFVRPLAFPAESELKMKIDVAEDENGYTVQADIPGVKKEDIQVDIDGGGDSFVTLANLNGNVSNGVLADHVIVQQDLLIL